MQKKMLKLLIALQVFTLVNAIAYAKPPIRLGVFAPYEGQYSALGQQIINAAEIAFSHLGDKTSDIILEQDECTKESGEEAALAMLEADVEAVVGFLCVASFHAAMPILAEAGIPLITLGVRSNAVGELAQKYSWPMFRLAPRQDAEVNRLHSFISKTWKDKPFALVDDGTVYGRELAESLRIKLQEEGVEPAYIQNYRPALVKQFSLIRSLEKAGVNHVFVGGDRNDIAIIARDAKILKKDMVFLGGDILNAAQTEISLMNGTLAAILPSNSTHFSSAEAVLNLQATDNETTGYSLSAYAAVEILAQARENTNTPEDMVKYIKSTSFNTSIGPINFNQNGERTDNPFVVMQWQSNRFIALK